jgi:hypothetical protein
MNTLTKIIALTVALLVTTVAHAEDSTKETGPFQFDAMECSKIAQKWIADPFVLTMGELDELALCARTLQSLKLQEQQIQKNQKAIDKLYEKREEP